jgi:hypothetical protein
MEVILELGESIERTTVNCSNLRMLEFLYPDYISKSTLFFDRENKVIYHGKFRKDVKEYLDNNTLSWINTVGPYDMDLDDKETLVKYVYSKWNKVPKDTVLEVVRNLQDIDFDNFIKVYWVLGKAPLDSADVTIYDLYRHLGKSKGELLKVYYKLLDVYNVGMLESSILTFIEKSMNYKDVEGSGHYMKLLKDFHDKYRPKIKALLMKYNMLDESKEVKLLWLLMQL